ncbi:DUF58 domain-containing protein [[Phormidium] sp. ETS-05]|uniref:DUF58 domain-containing protein n=1 Tax=[Phormidium] sp. ETS-05 TaxID=222819 RepID=UPI0018EEFDAD|nr:DUF58 domain-containing protein [[Phormidium] sp. ETS-05]
MKIGAKIAAWLERRWATPAYAGWVLLGMSLSLFGAATNTMAGWLYAISGISLAMLGMAAILPAKSLRQIQIRRRLIEPVSAGDELTVELEIENPTAQAKTLLEVYDVIPLLLQGLKPPQEGKPRQVAIEEIPGGGIYRWTYYQPSPRRGLYRWHEVELRSGAPLGLFWCSRSRHVPATAIVYPQVLPLNTCPVIDKIGQQENKLYEASNRAQMTTAGITRTLRPYRYGDPIRLVHWRSSARLGELRVRELEISTGGQEIAIALDSGGTWDQDDFEQAAIAAASIYFYASRSQLEVKLWTPATGLIQGNRVVLEALAASNPSEATAPHARPPEPPNQPLIWLTQNPLTLPQLPKGSRWIFWPPRGKPEEKTAIKPDLPGIEIQPDKPLQLQLQSPLR